jgi:hypothetical protein
VTHVRSLQKRKPEKATGHEEGARHLMEGFLEQARQHKIRQTQVEVRETEARLSAARAAAAAAMSDNPTSSMTPSEGPVSHGDPTHMQQDVPVLEERIVVEDQVEDNAMEQAWASELHECERAFSTRTKIKTKNRASMSNKLLAVRVREGLFDANKNQNQESCIYE